MFSFQCVSNDFVVESQDIGYIREVSYAFHKSKHLRHFILSQPINIIKKHNNSTVSIFKRIRNIFFQLFRILWGRVQPLRQVLQQSLGWDTRNC